MVDEAASASEASVTEVIQTVTEPKLQTLEPNRASIEATVESSVQGGTESTSNNNAAESAVSDEDREKTLEFAEEMTERASVFLKERDFVEAVDCFSRALEIRVAHYGELGAECVNAYYRYGSALLEKAQAEADPFGNMPKKEAQAQQMSSNNDGSAKKNANGESFAVPVVSSSNPERQGSSSGQEGTKHWEGNKSFCYVVSFCEHCCFFFFLGSGVKGVVEEDDLSDADVDADEDESDLEMAWKMLDIARAITDKHSIETIEKVDILSSLAEVSLEREDIESSLIDYKTALSTLERLVESDSRHLAELNFRICFCLETGSQPQEAVAYCQKAILICKARIERLNNEIKGPSGSATSSTVSEIDEGIQQSSNVPYIDKSSSDKEAEIGVLTGLAEDLDKKLEDLKQQVEKPKQDLAELMGMVASAKANADDKVPAPVVTTGGGMNSSRMGALNTGKDLESPTVSTAHTGAGGGGASSSGFTHLGVVGRGVKRVLMNATSAESSPPKRITPESTDKADGKSL
ncbi:unnamed protein product [Cochlearia groenlandica]